MQIDDIKVGADAPPPPAPTTPAGVIYVTDSTGRRIGLKKLKPSQRFSLAENVETKTPSGEMQAIFAASVFSIGEDGCPPITSTKDLLKRLDELDDHGLAAVTPELLKMYGVSLGEKDVAAAKLVGDPEFHQVHFLVHHGVALDRAEEMDPRERLAAYVAHGQFEGREFDWRRLRWKEPKK